MRLGVWLGAWERTSFSLPLAIITCLGSGAWVQLFMIWEGRQGIQVYEPEGGQSMGHERQTAFLGRSGQSY